MSARLIEGKGHAERRRERRNSAQTADCAKTCGLTRGAEARYILGVVCLAIHGTRDDSSNTPKPDS